MKKKISHFLTLVSFLALGIGAASSCSHALPEENKKPVVPDQPIVNPETKVETEVVPVSGHIDGSVEIENKVKQDIYNEDGGLLIPFDTAYPEYMNKALYDQNSILVKTYNHEIDAVFDTFKDQGVAGYEFVSQSTDDTSWFKLSLKDVKSNEVINTFRKTNSKALMFDLNYVIDKDGLYTIEEQVSQEAPAVATDPIDNCNINGAENNEYFKDQYYFKGYGLKESYKYLKDHGLPEGGQGVTVAVIDTGVDLDHEDLIDNIYTNTNEIPGNGHDDDNNGYVDDVHGWNFVDNDNSPDDDQGHGTHVAGIIAAKNNKVGTVGIAYNATIMPIKAGDASGSFTADNIAKAIHYAYLNGADVINMSFGGSYISLAEQEALEAAYTTASLVAAAGNDGVPNEDYLSRPAEQYIIPSYPAALSYVIGVMSVAPNNVESGFTNYDGVAYSDREYEVYAPGEGIMSTIPDNRYSALSGTSMSAPIVSGMIALMRTRFVDRVKFPSKFISAQLAGATTVPAHCLDTEQNGIHVIPLRGGAHNVPCIVNLNESFTKAPVPMLGLLTYRIFDSKEFNPINNNNGQLDAGETVYLAPTLINRYGMSKETTITFDTLSSISQQPSKYITIENEVLNFDGVGTYSTKHYLKLDENNSNYIGCDLVRSLKINVSKDAPNLINIPLNYQISYKNGLDDLDTNQYQTKKKTITLTSNNGVVLPKVIKQDMTLTKDHYYIIDTPTYVEEKFTLTVEAGTTIQFGNNSELGYQGMVKDSPKLTIYGSFVCNGAKDEMITLKSSRTQGAVHIETKERGNFDLNYVDVTNIYLNNQSYRENKNHFIENSSFLWNTEDFYHVENGEKHNWNMTIKLSAYNEYEYSDYSVRNCEFVNYAPYEGISLYLGYDVQNCLFRMKNCVFSNFVGHFKYCTFINESDYIFSFDIDDTALFSKYDEFFSSGNCYDHCIDLYTYYKDVKHTLKEYRSVINEFNKNEKIISINPFDYHVNSFNLNHSNGYTYFILEKIGNSFFLCDGSLLDIESNKTSSPKLAQKLEDYLSTFEDGLYIFGYLLGDIGNGQYDIKQYDYDKYIRDSHSYGLAYYKDVKKSQVVARLWELNGSLSESTNDYNNFLAEDAVHFSINVGNNEVTKGKEIRNAVNLNTRDETAIDYVLKDYADDPHRAIIGLASATDPELEKLWPYVLKCEFEDKDGIARDTYGKETINVRLTFNRDMNIDVPIRVRFGSSEPYAEYEIEGGFVSERTWVGSFFINTTIENGEQYLRIEGGQAKTNEKMVVCEAKKRFKFNIDTTLAMAQVINAQATSDGILLNWMQDEYTDETIMGYNVYRSDKKDGNYTKVNKNVVSKAEHTLLDTDVMPGESYWYTFTIVLSDFTETNPAGRVNITAKDTMNPTISHTPVYQGYTKEPLKLICKAKDNIGITDVKLYYRTTGTTDYKSVSMNKVNDTYSYVIPINELTSAGIEYYIEATDGTNYVTKGNSSDPYQVVIKDNSAISHLGDVDGNGEITVADAHMILKHIWGEVLLKDEQFRRADLNFDGELTTSEALRILQYINGNVTSLEM